MELTEAAAAITDYVRSGSPPVTPAVTEAADAFARACRALNDRLARCDAHLRSNQRSEALRLATAPPDVLKQFTVLDIKEWDRWAEAAAGRGLPVPPRLDDRTAARIHTAFVAEQKVVPILQELRRLALERAPLYQRLDALRRLAAAEPTNLGWADDLRAHEKARYEEIRDLLADPAYYRNWQVVSALSEELSGPWLTPKPADVTARLEKYRLKFLRRLGEAIERELGPKLEDAIADNDLPRVRGLHRQLSKAEREYQPPADSPVWALLRQADECLKRETEGKDRRRGFNQAVAAARRALAERADWADVQRCYGRVLAFAEFDPPADLARGYAARGRGRQLGRVAAAGLAVVALLLGVVLYFALAR